MSAPATSVASLSAWVQPDGSPIACEEKLKVLEENRQELATVMRDMFEDAVLMGVDEEAARRLIVAMAGDLRSPKRA